MKILVTAALPYANGEIHLGHLAGAYLPADIYVRYLRLKQQDVIFICGSDEHGVPITIAAEQQKVSPQTIVDRYHKSIKESFKKFGCSFDNYSRTSLPLHHKTAQEFFLKIYTRGYVYPKTISQFYCPECKMFLADRYVIGRCPYCENDKARGDQCELCGRWLEPFNLIEPKCRTCGSTPHERQTTHYFFKLSEFENALKTWIKEKSHWKDNVKKFCEGWFAQGLEDRAITRDLTWGVKVPLPEAQDKVLYVWFDAPIGYISSTKEWAEKKGKPDLWKDYWLDPKTKLVHFIGKDNIVFHAIVWPAMLMAHGDYVLPSEIPANEFLNLEGRKLSTSENWAVWLPEYLNDFEPDPLRYALGINLPENRDVDFTWRDFLARNNNELADILGNFINRVLVFTHKNFNGIIPKPAILVNEDLEVIKKIEEIAQESGELIEKFQLKDALKTLMTLPALGNRYFDYQAPWTTLKTNRTRCQTTINVCLKLVASLGILLEPFLPFTAQRIANMVKLRSKTWDSAPNPEFGPDLGEVTVLFRKIDEKIIEVQLKKLGSKKQTQPKENKMEVTLDEFKRIELKVAKVISAQRVLGTDKLVQLEIDLGTETRQIVAGIGHVYPPESLIGKNIVVVSNLQKAKIRGIESYGMLLAAVSDSDIALITTDKEIKPGSLVS
ncbi:MAG: methionine--tRNA ligase [candidate division WOR-3 bacterium]|nr:methionine--tRNA ligase [candidate division WOR-3 bacterium]MDW7987832.1 methionine--tRNA ligase [candidate division WOR-3 bacterium]